MTGYLGMRPGDLAGKRYAKYWQPEMAPLPPAVAQALLHGEEAAEYGLPLAQAHRLLEPEYLPLENGYTTLPDGCTYVAVRTEMPGVTGAMFLWWMGWHYMEHQRYKLWHPRSHVANGTREMRGDDPALSDVEKYLTTHYVTEFIGSRREEITITFVEPQTFLPQAQDVTMGGTTALVCGHVGLQRAPLTIGHLLHQIRETPTGTEMRSRFWLGKPALRGKPPQDWRNRLLGTPLLTRWAQPAQLGRDMVVHCAMEMNHLACFLPSLYEDYHRD